MTSPISVLGAKRFTTGRTFRDVLGYFFPSYIAILTWSYLFENPSQTLFLISMNITIGFFGGIILLALDIPRVLYMRYFSKGSIKSGKRSGYQSIWRIRTCRDYIDRLVFDDKRFKSTRYYLIGLYAAFVNLSLIMGGFAVMGFLSNLVDYLPRVSVLNLVIFLFLSLAFALGARNKFGEYARFYDRFLRTHFLELTSDKRKLCELLVANLDRTKYAHAHSIEELLRANDYESALPKLMKLIKPEPTTGSLAGENLKECPDCEAKLEIPDGVVPGEILTCMSCGLEIEIVSVKNNVVKLRKLFLDGDDWGQ